MDGMWWLMAANHELGEKPAARAPEPVVEPTPVVEEQKRLSCPKCGKTGRGIVIHIRNCKG
jgi:hypothetical protein